MNKIKSSKILKIIILFLIVGFMPIKGYTYNTASPSKVTTKSDTLGDLSEYAQTQEVSSRFSDMVGVILGVVQTIGSLLAVICLIVLGVKYMMGSVEEKAEYKKTLMPYLLGAIMVFGISNLLKIVYEIATSF